MAQKWMPIEPEDGNVGGDFALACRTYGLDGHQYPRLTIKLYKDVLCDPEAIKLSCNRKNGPEDWWMAQGVPMSLIEQAVILLHQVGAPA